MINQIATKFKELYSQNPILIRSPGRVNLIGEHTDYNHGFVLPAAIDKEVYLAIASNPFNICRIYGMNINESVTFLPNRSISRSKKNWSNYIKGVVAQFIQQGYHVKGFDLVFGGNIPIGAGLSSSAAIECGLAFALNHLYNFGIDKLDLVKMAQKAEHEFTGVQCGIMDQFANMFGKKGHVIKLDCRSLEHQYYSSDLHDYCIVLCDTQIKHSLAESEYNIRRLECETGVKFLHQYYPYVKSLRDVTIEMLTKHQNECEPLIYKRCLFVLRENNRVEEACQNLKVGDIKKFGAKMFASHAGLQHDYEVSCPELDFLVDLAKKDEQVLGARMMGGGFGGCTINIVRQDALDAFSSRMAKAYEQQFDKKLQTYTIRIVDGCSQYSNK